MASLHGTSPCTHELNIKGSREGDKYSNACDNYAEVRKPSCSRAALSITGKEKRCHSGFLNVPLLC